MASLRSEKLRWRTCAESCGLGTWREIVDSCWGACEAPGVSSGSSTSSIHVIDVDRKVEWVAYGLRAGTVGQVGAHRSLVRLCTAFTCRANVDPQMASKAIACHLLAAKQLL